MAVDTIKLMQDTMPTISPAYHPNYSCIIFEGEQVKCVSYYFVFVRCQCIKGGC